MRGHDHSHGVEQSHEGSNIFMHDQALVIVNPWQSKMRICYRATQTWEMFCARQDATFGKLLDKGAGQPRDLIGFVRQTSLRHDGSGSAQVEHRSEIDIEPGGFELG